MPIGINRSKNTVIDQKHICVIDERAELPSRPRRRPLRKTIANGKHSSPERTARHFEKLGHRALCLCVERVVIRFGKTVQDRRIARPAGMFVLQAVVMRISAGASWGSVACMVLGVPA